MLFYILKKKPNYFNTVCSIIIKDVSSSNKKKTLINSLLVLVENINLPKERHKVYNITII